MKILDVKLIRYKEIKPGAMKDGLPLSPRPELFVFETFNDEVADPVYVPNDPSNRHYWEVREWYVAQKKKPFKFEFLALPDDLVNQEAVDIL